MLFRSEALEAISAIIAQVTPDANKDVSLVAERIRRNLKRQPIGVVAVRQKLDLEF